MTVLLEEFTSLYSAVKPLLILLNLIVKHREHPYFTSLKPDELISIEHTAITVEASEISAILLILRLLKPEWKTIFSQLPLVKGCKFFKINSCHIIYYLRKDYSKSSRYLSKPRLKASQ